MNKNITKRFNWAVSQGSLKTVRELVGNPKLRYLLEHGNGYELLRDAIERKDTKIAKLLLQHNCRVNANSLHNSTPLHIAVGNGELDLVRMLLDRNANTNAQDVSGRTPLYIATAYQKIEIAELLLKREASVNIGDHSNVTPLHLAIKNYQEEIIQIGPSTSASAYTGNQTYVINKMEIIETLISKGASVNIGDNNGVTPLHTAVERGLLKIVTCLLNSKANINCTLQTLLRRGSTPLDISVEKNFTEIAALLLERGAFVDAKGQSGTTPLHIACKKGYLTIVGYLLEKGADVNFASTSRSTKGYTPLHFAANQGHDTVVELLLKREADIDIQSTEGKTALDLAAKRGCLRSVKHILNYHPDVNNQGHKSSLISAACCYHGRQNKIIESLTQYGFTINPEETNNDELVFAVVSRGYLPILRQLLQCGLDVNMTFNLTYEQAAKVLQVATELAEEEEILGDDGDFMLLHIAAQFEQEEVFNLLINHGAYINVADDTGKTPLLYAVKTNRLKIIKLLFHYDVNIKASDNERKTVLHFAASMKENSRFFEEKSESIRKKKEIIKLFLSKGVSVNAQDVYDETPLHVSVRSKSKEITEMLLHEGADVNARKNGGGTALEEAVSIGDKEIVELLLKHGAASESTLALHYAAETNNLEIVEILLKFLDDIDIVDKERMSALMYAAKEGHPEIVNTLLENGSDVNVQSKKYFDEQDQTALELAIEGKSSRPSKSYDYDRTIELLKERIIQIACAGLPITKQNKKHAFSKSLSFFVEGCEKEVDTMKTEMIGNTNVSFYNILNKSGNNLVAYLRNEDIVEVLQFDEYIMSKFPCYASFIKAHLKKGMKRKVLLEQGNKRLHYIFSSFVVLPYNCIEKIISYLGNKELKILEKIHQEQ